MAGLNLEMNERWEKTKERINSYLEEILLKIEWRYGDCRAPFLFPPVYDIIIKDKIEYVCIVTIDPAEFGELRYTAEDPFELFYKVKEDINEKFLV